MSRRVSSKTDKQRGYSSLSNNKIESINEFPEGFLLESKGALEAFIGRELSLEECRDIINNLVNLEEYLQYLKHKASGCFINEEKMRQGK